MMEKENLLAQIRSFVAAGKISKEEILNAFETGQTKAGESHDDDDLGAAAFQSQNRLSAIFYFIGALIVVVGVVVMVSQNWNQFSNMTKILLTFGSGVIAFSTGVILAQEKKWNLLSQCFLFISGLLLPTGLQVTLHLNGWQIGDAVVQSFTSAVLVTMFGAAFFLFRKNIALIFCVIFGSWLYFSVCEWLLSSPVTDPDQYAYRVLVWGLSLLFLGHYFSQETGARKTLASWLMAFGIVGFLGAGLSLAGKTSLEERLWEFLYPFLTFAVIYLSVYLKNRSFLFFGALFLIFDLGKITSDYFANSLGWALCLVIIGFFIMSIGYFAFYVNRRFIK